MKRITLATLPQATPEEVFEQVARHMLTQCERSASSGGCAYRGDGGLMCAAGCLISDDEYSPEFEEKLWGSLVAKGLVPEEHTELIEVLQEVHDQLPVDRWAQYLKGVASGRRIPVSEDLEAFINSCGA